MPACEVSGKLSLFPGGEKWHAKKWTGEVELSLPILHVPIRAFIWVMNSCQLPGCLWGELPSFLPFLPPVIPPCALPIGTYCSSSTTSKSSDGYATVSPLPNSEGHQSNVYWPGFSTLVRNLVLWDPARPPRGPQRLVPTRCLLCHADDRASPPGRGEGWTALKGHSSLSRSLQIQDSLYGGPGQWAFAFSSTEFCPNNNADG